MKMFPIFLLVAILIVSQSSAALSSDPILGNFVQDGNQTKGHLLFFFPVIPKSAMITFMPVAEELAKRGHQVFELLFIVKYFVNLKKRTPKGPLLTSCNFSHFFIPSSLHHMDVDQGWPCEARGQKWPPKTFWMAQQRIYYFVLFMALNVLIFGRFFGPLRLFELDCVTLVKKTGPQWCR